MSSILPRLGLPLLTAALIGLPTSPTATQQSGSRGRQRVHADFDIRDARPDAAERVVAGDEAQPRAKGRQLARRARRNRESGTIRVLDRPGIRIPSRSGSASIRALLSAHAQRFGLERQDLEELVLARDYTSRSTGIRHLIFRQNVDGIPVFESAIGVHVVADGSIARVTSNAAPTDGRNPTPDVSAARARVDAAADTGNDPSVAGEAALAWLPVDGSLRLAWHVLVSGDDGPFDVLVDAHSGEVLLRRSRARDTEGYGRVLQGAGTAAIDPRQPDPMPFGADGTPACPPPVNDTLRSLNAQFRDPETVLSSTGRLEGNNVKVFRGATGQSAEGTFDGSAWTFDFPFNSAGSAETYLFFAMNFAHDFFYDLGFDEAAGNFQVDNFGRGGLGGDPIRAKARALGRNNANYVHAADGNSSTINMFLWDGNGCWGEDVDFDGFPDLDGDYDADIIIHEYHHGVSLRLNTAFSGTEAGAIGEGGSDFFAYSIFNDPTLAEYARPGGLRRVNNKGYGDWTCAQGFFCEVHANGEIWANVMWDLRGRLRSDLVGGTEDAAINESHQLYIDGLKLSPPRPTMLDMRDAILVADAIRNPGSPSHNFCRIWESFAGRGMGVSATDTADNGQNRVGPAYDVPAGCVAPPLPPLMTAIATAPAAYEAGTLSAAVTFRRSVAAESAVTVSYTVSGTASVNNDYVALPLTATIPPGALEVTVPVVPVDDGLVENNETVTLTVASGTAYAVGSPAFATITIVSDDVAPDLVVTGLTAAGPAGAGTTINVTESTKNQGTGLAGSSQTSFYLSSNLLLDASDPLLGMRDVSELASGATSTGSVPLVLPDPLTAGTYYLFAKADGPGAVAETNELNNTRVLTLAVGPDLVVTALSAPAQAAPGGSILVSDTTKNQGGGAAAASATRFFLSVNILFDASDTPLEARAVGGLSAGASSAGSATVTIPLNTVAGSYYLFAQADAGGAVGEPNEVNNTRMTTIRIGADLTVTALTVPARGAAGSTIAVTDTTRNTGSGSSGASATAFYLSSNLMLDAADIRLQPSRPVPGLATNEFSTATTNVLLPPEVTPGAWYILANADDQHAVPETIESNNVRFAGLQIGPDLSFLSVASPASAVSGASITVTDTVRNIGAATAGPSAVRYYLSTNFTFDAADIPLNAERPVGSIAPNASNTGSASVPLPSGMTGTFYLIVVADGGGAVPESSELNNAVQRLIQIGAGT
jgi:subtilase family serine protease